MPGELLPPLAGVLLPAGEGRQQKRQWREHHEHPEHDDPEGEYDDEDDEYTRRHHQHDNTEDKAGEQIIAGRVAGKYQLTRVNQANEIPYAGRIDNIACRDVAKGVHKREHDDLRNVNEKQRDGAGKINQDRHDDELGQERAVRVGLHLEDGCHRNHQKNDDEEHVCNVADDRPPEHDAGFPPEPVVTRDRDQKPDEETYQEAKKINREIENRTQ